MFPFECGSDKTGQSFSHGSDLSSTLQVLEDGCKSPLVCVCGGGERGWEEGGSSVDGDASSFLL